ncbi:MAG: hypothetical protein QOH81_973 [Sphingomonadales bacterium]|jgi:cob(I)alamin adenosyltransferase|nr:hypothetical protein [Sphingomonadales bacterium]
MCAKVDSARTVQRCAERLHVACARLGALRVEAETPDWARALLDRRDEASKREGGARI